MGQGLPITRACAAARISRSSFHYESRKSDDVELLERIKELREKKPRWDYKRVRAKLRKKGFQVNHKRVERISREYGFTLSARRRRKKVRTGETVPEAAMTPNHVWTYDFMFDATFGGRRMMVLSLIDEFTREALAIVPARSLTASAVKGVLARLFVDRERPAVIRRACYESPVNSPSLGYRAAGSPIEWNIRDGPYVCQVVTEASRSRKIRRARCRLRQRLISRGVFPSAARLSAYVLVSWS